MYRRFFLWMICLLSVAPFAAWGDTNISIHVDPTEGSATDIFTMEVVAEGGNAQALGAPSFESSKDFEITQSGTSSNLTIINGQQSYKLSYQFSLSPVGNLPPGDYQIPRGYFTYRGDKVYLKQPTISIRAAAANERRSGAANFVQYVDNIEPYVGQQILYRAEFATPYGIAEADLGDPDFSGALHESFGKQKETVRQIANSDTKVYAVREALYPNASGELTIPRRTLRLRLQVPTSARRDPNWSLFDDIWGGVYSPFQLVTKTFVAEPVTVKVRPLPPQPADVSGYIPVGEVALDVKVDHTSIKEGESFNLSVTVSGDANLRPFELTVPSSLSQDFKIYPDKAQLNAEVVGAKIMMTKLYNFALVPLRPGKLSLPELKLVSFDPKVGRYKVLNSNVTEIEVLPDASSRKLESSDVPTKGESGRAVSETAPPVIGEDLLPQHIGASLFVSSKPIEPFTRWLVLFGAPLVTFVVYLWRLYRTRLAADPELVKQRMALTKFIKLIDDAGVDPADVSRIVKLFLKERLRFAAEGLTANEIVGAIESRCGDRSLAGELGQILGECERVSYSGGAGGISVTRMGEIKQRLKSLAVSIDRGGK